jgi:hypothetical protein
LDIEALAKAIHALYVEAAKARGETPATNPACRPWDELSEDLRQANRAQAADIPTKLRMLGYELTADRGLAPAEIKISEERVERVAIYEHERWMAERRRQGWTYAKIRDNARKLHPLLVAWDQLPEREREKDRATVRALPGLVETAGFRVRRIAEAT